MAQLKWFDVEIVSSGSNQLPPSGLVELSLEDVSLADAPSVSIAKLQLRCGGVMPINMQLPFDMSQISPAHSYALAARIQVGDTLLYINTQAHFVEPNTALTAQRVTVDKVQDIEICVQPPREGNDRMD
ncbi:YbaY family lipoprotein [Pseudomonas sp.]|uniref:YbaY family lipoprotein n=1 Tax=Pseudomonas sp. TaxID=306 RepID=UPI0028AC0B4A|nr:YbaY family lipoprotein [Pseudomonas sp.]